MNRTFLYSAFDLTIESEIELPELPDGKGEVDIVVRLGKVPRGRRYLTLEEATLLPRVAGFLVRGGKEIVVDPIPGGDAEWLRILLLGRVMGILLRQRGWLPVHASGVLLWDRAVLFAACSGGGKSTTAAAFHANGHTVIADDMAAVRLVNGECVLMPAWPHLRLRGDSLHHLGNTGLRARTDRYKYWFDLPGGAPSGVIPLGAIYILEFGTQLRTEPIPPLSSIPILGESTILGGGGMDRETLSIHLKSCAAIAEQVPVRRLIRPKSDGNLSDLVSLVIAENGGSRAGSPRFAS